MNFFFAKIAKFVKIKKKSVKNILHFVDAVGIYKFDTTLTVIKNEKFGEVKIQGKQPSFQKGQSLK